MRILLAAVAGLFFTLVAHGQETQAPRQATLTQQKMCADQAKRAFHEMGAAEPKGKHSPLDSADYTSHYDAKVNVCYIMTSSVQYLDGVNGGTQSVGMVVSDAFEGRVYARYLKLLPFKGDDLNVKPGLCSVKPRGQPEITCKDSDEFEQLVDKHFGVAQ
jgi:hypothetical protein